MATTHDPLPEPAVRREIEVDSDPDDVWELLTDDDERASWFGGPSVLEPVPGGGGRFEDHDGTHRTALVDEADPGRRLSWTWWPSDDDGPAHRASRVEIELTPLPGGTRISVTETPLTPVAQASALAGSGGPLLDLEIRVLLRSRVPVVLART